MACFLMLLMMLAIALWFLAMPFVLGLEAWALLTLLFAVVAVVVSWFSD